MLSSTVSTFFSWAVEVPSTSAAVAAISRISPVRKPLARYRALAGEVHELTGVAEQIGDRLGDPQDVVLVLPQFAQHRHHRLHVQARRALDACGEKSGTRELLTGHFRRPFDACHRSRVAKPVTVLADLGRCVPVSPSS